jgi:acetoin utilization protein AcuB
MIVSEVMTTRLVTVTPDDTLSHAANLLRQHSFHHLPVVREVRPPAKTAQNSYVRPKPLLLLEGIVTTQDIELAVALEAQSSAEGRPNRNWQDRRVAEVMHPTSITISPTTSVAAAAQILVERGLNSLPVVDYDEAPSEQQATAHEERAVLVGLLTRSDLLVALARSLGAFEPGVDIILPLPAGNPTPLAKALLLAAQLHLPVRSILAAPLGESTPRVATLRLGTIHPTPLLMRLHEAHIEYSLVDLKPGGDAHV